MEVLNLAQHFNEHLNRGEQITVEWLASNLCVSSMNSDKTSVALLGNYSCNHTVRISAKTQLFHYEFVSTLSTSLSNGAECMNNDKLDVLGLMPTFINDREVIQSHPAQLFVVSNPDNITGTNDDKLLAAIKWLNLFTTEADEKSFNIDIINFSKAIINGSDSVLAGSGGFGTPEYQLRNTITNKANRILQESYEHDGKIELMSAVYNMHKQGMSSVISNLTDVISKTVAPNL